MRLNLGNLSLGRLCSLLAQCLSLLLLLRAWGGRSVDGAGFEVHRRYKGSGELLLGYERVQFRLLGRPSLQRVDIEQSTYEVDKGYPVVHF
jgi:hypothetical protein